MLRTQTFIIFKISFNNKDTLLYNAPFSLSPNSQLSNCSFCQQLDAKKAANSNLALILGHPIYI